LFVLSQSKSNEEAAGGQGKKRKRVVSDDQYDVVDQLRKYMEKLNVHK